MNILYHALCIVYHVSSPLCHRYAIHIFVVYIAYNLLLPLPPTSRLIAVLMNTVDTLKKQPGIWGVWVVL